MQETREKDIIDSRKKIVDILSPMAILERSLTLSCAISSKTLGKIIQFFLVLSGFWR